MPNTKKRTAGEAVEGSPKRPVKARKTTKATSREKGGSKTSLGATAFKAHALPLHLNLTHSPPAITGEAAEGSASDVGFIGTTALLPCTFSTGSFGWKGSRRISIELLNNNSGVKEKVQVMLTVNATVVGSKNSESNSDEDGGVQGSPEEVEGSSSPENETGSL